MHFSSLIFTSLLSSAAVAQQVVSYTEPASGINFVSVARGAFNFGLSLPKETTGNDFLGHIAGSKSMGWAGGALGDGMVGPLLLVAWPNGKDVKASIRKAANKRGSPPVYDGAAKLVTIPKGTYVSDNGFSYTFLCQGCLSDPSVAFTSNSSTSRFAYAASPQPVPKPGEDSTPLTMHTIGMGGFTLSLEKARFDQYGTWAALATGGAAGVAPAVAAAAAAASPAAAAAASPAAPSA